MFWDCISIRIFDTANKSKTDVINSILSISLTQSILASSKSKVKSKRPVDNLLELFTVFDEKPADSNDSKSDLGGQVGFSFGFESPLSGALVYSPISERLRNDDVIITLFDKLTIEDIFDNLLNILNNFF